MYIAPYTNVLGLRIAKFTGVSLFGEKKHDKKMIFVLAAIRARAGCNKIRFNETGVFTSTPGTNSK